MILDREERHEARGEDLRLLPRAVPQPAVPAGPPETVQGRPGGTHLEPQNRSRGKEGGG